MTNITRIKKSSSKQLHTYNTEELLEWLQGNPSHKDHQYRVLYISIFSNNDMFLLSELIKHHDLCNDLISDHICVESKIEFFKFIFSNDQEFITKFNTKCLFLCIKNNNYEVMNILLERYPEIIYSIEIDSHNYPKNILHYLGKSKYPDLFRTIAARYPQALTQKGYNNCYPLTNLIENDLDKHLIDDIVRECLEYGDENDSKYLGMIYRIVIKLSNLTTQCIIFEKLKKYQILIDQLLIDFIELANYKFKYESLYETIEILLRDYDADPNKHRNNYGVNAVEIACNNEEYEILLILEKYNGNLNNQKLIEECAGNNKRTIIKHLKDNYDLDLNVKFRNSEYTLAIDIFERCESYNSDACEYLSDCDIDFTAVNYIGDSFLHLWIKKCDSDVFADEFALTNMKMKMIFKLIDRGVDPYHKNMNGDCFFNIKPRTIYDMLYLTYDEYKMLHEYGIDLTILNEDNHNLLDILCKFYNDKMDRHNKKLEIYYKYDDNESWDEDDEYYDNLTTEYNKMYNLFANELNMTLSE